MKIVGFCLMTGLALGLPFAASAQQSAAGSGDRDAREETRRQEDRPAARRQSGAAAGLNEQYAVTVRAPA